MFFLALVSLMVGGVGIMDIMLVSVTERTREIGLRMAIGARGRDVLMQFLVEAIVISLVGGALGLLFGFGMSALIGEIPFDTPSLPTVKTYPIDYNPQFYLIGAIFSIITTYFAGYFPSKKASRIDPVDIIRGK